MKTTLDISDELLKAAKQMALDAGTTLRQVVESALAQHLKFQSQGPVPIKTVVFPAVVSAKALSAMARDPLSTEKMGPTAFDPHSKDYWDKRFGSN